MPTHRIRNLGISRQLAITIAIVAVCAAAVTVVVAGGDATVTVSFIGVLATLVAALKATEAADTVSKVSNTVQGVKTVVDFTASQHAAVMQLLHSHCGDICPLDDCPLRSKGE